LPGLGVSNICAVDAEAIPEGMKQYKNLYKIIKNPRAVINKMMNEGHTELDFQKWIEPSHMIDKAAKQFNMKQPTASKKQPIQSPVVGAGANGNILPQIRKGKWNLKKPKKPGKSARRKVKEEKQTYDELTAQILAHRKKVLNLSNSEEEKSGWSE